MPTNRPQATAAQIAKITTAEEAAAAAEKAVAAAAAALEEAQRAEREAAEEAGRIRDAELADQIAWDKAQALTHHDAHESRRQSLAADLATRHAKHPKRANGELDIDPDKVLTIAIDGKIHIVTSRTPLKLGTRGRTGEHQSKPRPGSRYVLACGLQVDAAHDELVLDEYAQAKSDCPRCETAIQNPVPQKPSFNPPAKKKPTA